MTKPSYEHDTTKEAKRQLDRAIAAEQIADERDPDNEVLVDMARRQQPLVAQHDQRTKARVLFVTTDTSFLNPADDALERFFSLVSEFDEIHIMILRPGIIPTKPVLRVRPRVWVYIASAEYWWWTPVIAHEEIAANQLVFAAGFRPDLVVALEPFEAGLAAQWIGAAYKRPVQIHVRRNFRTRAWRKADSRNKWRAVLARYVLGRASSVRCATQQIRSSIESWCRSAESVALLPRFNNFTHTAQHLPEFDVHEKYPMYEKIILYIGALQYDSSLFGAIDSMKYTLANPRVGLIVIGDGPIRVDCERKLQKLGLQTQVVFAKAVTEVATYLKTADVLFVSDTTAIADELVLQAAVTTLPAIMLETELRRDYFTDTQNAYICPQDMNCFREKLHSLVHDLSVRQKFIDDLRLTVRPRLIEDARVYHARYRESIERMVIEDGR